MPTFLTVCRDDYFITEEFSATPSWVELAKLSTSELKRNLEVGSKILSKVLGNASITECEPGINTNCVVRVEDAYEAIILSIHVGTGMSYIRSDGKVCRVHSVESKRIYNYGIRDITRDIPELERLVRETRYIIVRDERRSKGSTKAVFMDVERSLGIDSHEVVILPITVLGEPFYEALGGYVLRKMGYLVTHQGLITELLPPPYHMPGVPDVEAVHVGDRGAFFYEISIMKKLGVRFSPKIGSTAAGEAKGSRYDFSSGLGQLIGYLDSGLYDEGYVIVPNSGDRISEAREKGVGVITFEDDGTLMVVTGEPKWGRADKADAVREVVANLLERFLG